MNGDADARKFSKQHTQSAIAEIIGSVPIASAIYESVAMALRSLRWTPLVGQE